MASINILDENTIDKIAAGEVVERPASVVKELVENSIDSGASAITVEIKEGGISYIRVTDNGVGIEKSEIKKAFLRHATSKINNVMDLFRISSLGFRGEALSSICAVSAVELLTKTQEAFSGSRYLISGGKEECLEDVGVPNGTTIIVRNLFYNTPARKKFLKSSNTEAGYISDLMEKFILSHPEITFKYMVNGMDRLVSPGNNDIKSAIFSVFGKNPVSSMLPVSISCDDFVLNGYIGKPEICRSNRNFEYFFVNNRIVKSKVLSAAVEEAYKNYLMLHKYPFVVLYFDIEPMALDINVHPAKTEIKFLNESILCEKLKNTIDSALHAGSLIPQVSAYESVELSNAKTSKPNSQPVKAPEPFETTRSSLVSDRDTSFSRSFSYDVNNTDNALSTSSKSAIADEETINLPCETDNGNLRTECIKETQTAASQINLFDDFLTQEAVISHKIIGQLFDTYWLIEYDNKLYIIDQHAAHEKVLYERIVKRLRQNDNLSQLISPPQIVSLSAGEEEKLNQYAENLMAIGFAWEHFGGREYSINAVPCDLFGLESNDYFITILDDLSVGKKPTPDAVNDRIATMACKAAVKANHRLSFSEAKALIDELMTLENPYNCPHGRPVIVSYSKAEIEKMFKRIV